MSVDIKNVHIGKAIATRLGELNISKSELGRRINIPQQHINRMLEKESIDTARLVAVCNAMDFNFFSLYSEAVQKRITGYIQMVATSGAKVQNNVGENQVTNTQCPFNKEEWDKMDKEIKSQKKDIANKDSEIRKLKEKNLLLESEINSRNAQMALLHVNIKGKDDNIEQLKSNIKTKDDVIELLRQQLEQYQQLLKERIDGK